MLKSFSILSHNDLNVDSREIKISISFNQCSDHRYNPPCNEFDTKSTISFLSHLKKGINETINTHNNTNYVYGNYSISISYYSGDIEIDILKEFIMGKNNRIISCHNIQQFTVNEAKKVVSEIINAALHHKEYVINELNKTLSPLIDEE